MPSTSWMFLPLYLTSRMPALYRVPLHSSHGSSMSARNCISTVTVPSPSQTSQRPPGTLKEKCPGPKPRRLASGGAAERGLVDEDDVVEVVSAGEFAVEMRGVGAFGLAERLHEGAVEDLVDDGGFAGAADAGDAAE